MSRRIIVGPACRLPGWIRAAAGCLLAVCGAGGVTIGRVCRAEPPASADRPLAVRVQWGGGQPRAWSGTIAIEPTEDVPAGQPVEPLAWRTLSIEPDAAAMVHEAGGVIVVHQPRPVTSDGIEIDVPRIGGRKLVVTLASAASGRPAVTVDVPLADLVTASVPQPLDDDGNRLTVKPAPGESLRVTVTAAAGEAPVTGATTVRRPGEKIRCTVDPLLPAKPDAIAVELRMKLRAVTPGLELASQTAPLLPLTGDAVGLGERRPVRFEPVVFDVTLPGDEGVYEIDLEAVERGGLRWTRPLATRTVQVVAVADAPAPVVTNAAWKVAYELDPGSPRLHERLRRLPGVGLPQMSLPSVPLPAMSLPNITPPSVPLPKLPSVPSISSMVPKLGGLLATGHSRVEPHGLGPMLRLPPADDAGGPAWEGILVAAAEPGRPHVVEIEFPSDQDAVVATTVLELDAAGAAVQVRHSGGFEVRRDALPGVAAVSPRLEVHRFVFWPTTRTPLLVLANPSRGSAAVFGRVRILNGPERLPPAAPTSIAAAANGAARRVHAFFPGPDLAEFGGPLRAEREGGRCSADWRTHLAGVVHSANSLAAQGAAGAMVPVYAAGAAIWPSRCTHHAGRWGAGSGGDAALDPEPRDVLELFCRVYGREGLRLVPALSFDAPLPALEEILSRGGEAAVGIGCVGRDGRPRRTPAGVTHYNLLDPRVQAAVLELVLELAGRVRGRTAVDTIALLVPHDGWLHLPGTAWGLDDATFGRFLAAVRATEPRPDAGRFAARAALVEGPLREQWLRWRAEQLAAFHGRLADAIAEHDERLSLALVPTTLLSSGEIAGRFRPALGPPRAEGELLREFGLDPVKSAEHPRVVFVSPAVCGGESLADRTSLTAANRALAVARAAAGVPRRAAVILVQERRLDLSAAVAHGAFGSATAPDAFATHVLATGLDRDRVLAEPFIAADAEAVYDMRLAYSAAVARPPSQAAIESLPSGRLALVDGLPAPLVVRTRRGDEGSWVHLVNAAPVPGRVGLAVRGRPIAVVDAADMTRLPLSAEGDIEIPLEGWGMRCLWLEGDVVVTGARMRYEDTVREAVARRISRLGRQRATLETPVPLDVLDNPGFELGSAAGDGARPIPGLPGWELLEPRRGSLGLGAGAGPSGGRAAVFSSANGLATLRSNPFTRPRSGRLSIAAWLRIREGDPQPPLRIALEGVQGDREYYRFAAVGGLTGGRPLTAEWSQFVLQIDDLPEAGLESLRVRFDLLGPGNVEIDGVRLFDLAFDESQRVQMSRLIAGLEQRLAADDVGGCLVELDGHWPRYLEAFVPEAEVPATESAAAPGTGTDGQPEARAGMFERMRRWWQ